MKRALTSLLGALLLISLSPRPALANDRPYYYLPWDGSAWHEVTQGNNGSFSHFGQARYAWDFGGDGWLVRATRAGKVSHMYDGFGVGACDPFYLDRANYVTIVSVYGDNNEALYLHLAQGSVTSRSISLNLLVARDTPLGLTDSSGYTCNGNGTGPGPHLHYAVQTPCASYYCQSVPSSFMDPDVLRQNPTDGVPKSYPTAPQNQTVVSANSGYGRPLSGGQWLLKFNNGPPDAWDVSVSPPYGFSGDLPLPGKWCSNGGSIPTGLGIVRQGVWYLRCSSTPGPPPQPWVTDGGNPTIPSFAFGWASDIPVAGDWTGKGFDTIGLVRPENGSLMWYLRNNNSNGPAEVPAGGPAPFAYGWATDIPIVGKWNGVVTGIGVVRPENGGLTWLLKTIPGPGSPDISPYGASGFHYGVWNDVPVVGCWMQGVPNCQWGMGIVRLAAGHATWFLRNSLSEGFRDYEVPYQLDTDAYLTGNWRTWVTDSTPATTIAVGR
jgi:hypothetical protein